MAFFFRQTLGAQLRQAQLVFQTLRPYGCQPVTALGQRRDEWSEPLCRGTLGLPETEPGQAALDYPPGLRAGAPLTLTGPIRAGEERLSQGQRPVRSKAWSPEDKCARLGCSG